MNTSFGSLCFGVLTLGLLSVMARATASAASEGSGEQIFITQAAIGGMAEVEMGKLAGEKASSPAVKKFAAQMVSDHTKANGSSRRSQPQSH